MFTKNQKKHYIRKIKRAKKNTGTYEKLCSDTDIDKNQFINVIPEDIAVYGDEIFVLDKKLIIYVYDFQNYRLLRTFDIGSHLGQAKYTSLICVTDKDIYIDNGACSCCKTNYIRLNKYNGSFLEKFTGDGNLHINFKTHEDNLYIYRDDPTSDLGYPTMYTRNFSDFKNEKITQFCEKTDDFVCDGYVIFYIKSNRLCSYNLGTRSIIDIDMYFDTKNKSKRKSIFLVDDTIMICNRDELHVVDKHTLAHLYTNKIDCNKLMTTDNTHMQIFKNKLFMWNKENYIKIYELKNANNRDSR